MAGNEREVESTLTAPDEVRQSRTNPHVMLFYRLREARTFVCAVARRQGSDGFLFTAYIADRVKEGVRIWPT